LSGSSTTFSLEETVLNVRAWKAAHRPYRKGDLANAGANAAIENRFAALLDQALLPAPPLQT
jgi:hypothetical protein